MSKKATVKSTNVKVKVRATSEGYYGDRIIRIGEEFVYEGALNRQNKLPLWVEALEKFESPKAVKADPAAPAAPVAEPVAPVAEPVAPIVVPASPVLPAL